jgi:CTP synthase (UTP-ammonia lyase)
LSRRLIALVGDHDPAVTAHRAIPVALGLCRDRLGADLAWEWVATRAISDAPADLARFSGVWLVPASPYANTPGAIGAVRFARTTGRPFLGTCGGFQHALIEVARDVAGIPDADHAETNPGGRTLVVTRLSCSLVEKTGKVRFKEGSLLARAYGSLEATEGYRCNYGLNRQHVALLEIAGLRFTAEDEAGDIRGAELPSHPFFAGVLFQPERAALKDQIPPLVLAFASAAVSAAQSP